MTAAVYSSYHIADYQPVHKLKVFDTIDVPVLHELEVLLIHTSLDLGRHRLSEQLSLVSLLNKGLDRLENWAWSLHCTCTCNTHNKLVNVLPL